LIQSPSEEEEEKEEDNEREYDEDEVTLFIKKFNKLIKKRKPYNWEMKEKPMLKRVCYNYGKNEHFCDTPSVIIAATVPERWLAMYFGSLNEILASLSCT
jgi:hypothetical protein